MEVEEPTHSASAWSRRELIPLLLVAVLVVFAAVLTVDQSGESHGGAPGENNSMNTSLETELASLPTNGTNSPCRTAFLGGLEGPGLPLHAFLIPAEAMGQICVKFDLGGQASNNVSLQGRVLVVNATYFGAGQNHSGYQVNSETAAPGITETTSPPSVDSLSGSPESTITVVYNITTSLDSQGVYALTYPFACPSWIRPAVGYDSSTAQHLITKDYQIFTMPGSCVASATIAGAYIVGISGLAAVPLNSTGL
jgi:hypothetical protein